MKILLGGSRAAASGMILLATLFLTVPADTTAQTAGNSRNRVRVVGHLALAGMRIDQMFLQPLGERSYLYLHRSNEQAFALVDVTRADKPVLLEREALKERPGARVEMVKSEAVLAVSVSPEGRGTGNGTGQPAVAAAEETLPSQTVRLIDLSDPRHPEAIQTFTGVTSMAQDDARRLLFLVNAEGLWVVVHPEVHIVPPCGTQASLMIEPNCQ